MKSVMQEASSIAKAFEQAWEKAGKPQQCSVKILEEPRHNFIGMTVQSAKIALFFGEPENRNFSEKTTGGQAPRNDRQAPKPQERKPVASQKNVPQQPVAQRNVVQEPKKPVQQFAEKKTNEQRPDYWSEEMISFARNWLKDLFVAMDRSDTKFDVEANKFYLRFSFEKPVYEDELRERDLFRNASCLLLQTLRNKFNRPLKGYKVVLARA